MAAIKTINFLPEVFRTNTNQKFLNATLDQLVTPPDLRKVNAYIGRKFAPTYKTTDNYQPEPTSLRQNYQLEPSVVVTDKTGNVDFFSSYIDLLNQLEYNGSLVNNQSRLFSNEVYSFNGAFDFDKLVNFNQYYWLPDGPETVSVFGTEVPASATYTVTRDASSGSYYISGFGTDQNPALKLARGGVYKFIVNQPGYPFWIQSEPGRTGLKNNQSNLTSREVLGVENNGIDVGTVTVRVPQLDSQAYYTNMPLVSPNPDTNTPPVDVSTNLHYTQIQGATVSQLTSLGGLDGITAQYSGKTIIFTNTDIDDTLWTVNGVTVPVSERRHVYKIQYVNPQANDPTILLVPQLAVSSNQRVYVSSGQTQSEWTFYLDSTFKYYRRVPSITAPQSTLYYQDATSSTMVGSLNLVVITDTSFNVDTEIIGQKNYVSPNGVKFTNGLKISFDSSATPATYAGNTYYVEGVGSSIKLIPDTSLITPEAYAVNGITTPDYITINRSSQDLNPWTRSNRWFHIDVIKATAEYNNAVPVFNQTARAQRPIIEFEADLQLHDFGRMAKKPVDIFDTTITDARNQVELEPYFVLDGIALSDGMRVVFANDLDPTVRNQIFTVKIVEINRTPVINLVAASDAQINAYNNLVVLQGTNKGTEYYYNGSQWVNGQQKTSVNQKPKFDIIDVNGISIGNADVYNNSNFAGTDIFSYKAGTGSADKVLGFPLSYRTFNQVGDIQFTNNFDSDTFTYYENSTAKTVNINSTGFLRQNQSLTSYNIRNVWTTVVENSKQYQIISNVYDGVNNSFNIDVLPQLTTSLPHLKVFQKFKEVAASNYSVTTVGVKHYLTISADVLTAGDQIDILIYSKDVSSIGHYQVPDNLNLNSENANFESLTLGQMQNHLVALVSNSNTVVGSAFGTNNLRDVQIKQQGGNILQHASPVLYSELFTVDSDANFFKSLEYARHNYSRFKNKILESAVNLKTIDINNIPGVLDTILLTINAVKTSSFPWYYSDMVPYGPLKRTITYTVLDVSQTDYEISSVFDDTVLSNRAVLVYLNGTQLVKGQDYTFDTTRAGVTLFVALNYDDVITINEYSSTDGNYIPETPTKLGLYPKFTPMMYTDTTYVNPIQVIQGHDGSITPAFGDFRDELLLEFEKRIYNNIKTNYQERVNSIYNYMPGKFRDTDYTNKEFTQLLTRSFLQWVGSNRVDFTTNSYFIASDPFTWNYSRFIDTVDGEQLTGTWRSIYKYFYDTDTPNTTPWEMVGFSEMPTWWEDRYGPAPYTGGNLPLWEDMSQGLVWNGSEATSYIDSRFVRPGLLSIIPVDINGNLRPPTQFAVKGFNSNQANGSYAVGQYGPVETAWRRSSDYPYAVQEALALANPAYYFGTLIDVNRYYKNAELNQYVAKDTLQRITPTDINLNGEKSGTTTLRAAGYLNWIADYLRNQGIDPMIKINDYLSGVNVQLAYKMAGYSDKSFVEVLAEQASPTSTTNSVVIPKENYKIQLNKSTPTSTITYSAVVIEKSANGYTVSGYDTSNPYFTIIPSVANNRSYTIRVINDIGVIYQDFQSYKVTVPYGYEFTNKQQIVDFLVSYERYLKGVGVIFQDQDTSLNTQRNFVLSAQEFLTWSQQGWQTGSVLVLSPIADHLVVSTANGVIDQIENTPLGSRILDTSYNFIKYNNLTVNRFDNTFSLTTTSGQTIALAQLDVVEYEHVLIFDNTTVFNDVIYVPALGNRQYRLKVVGQKTGSWTGLLNPPGFIYNSPDVDQWQSGVDYPMGSLVQYKEFYYTNTQNLSASASFDVTDWQRLTNDQIRTGLLPNFSYNAEKFKNFMSFDNPEMQGDFANYVGTDIGFYPRDYLTNFGIDIPTQAKFYQGFIRQKGSKNSVTALTAVGFNDIAGNISLYEEWAFRVGEFGALNNNQFVEVPFTEGVFNGDPVTFTLLPNNGSTTDNIVGVYPANLYATGTNYSPSIYNNRSGASYYGDDIATAGYVSSNDIDLQIFDMANYVELNQYINSVGIGTKIWAAKDTSSTSWDVYRVTENNYNVINFAYSVDVIATVTVDKAHNLNYGDFIVIKGFDGRIDGFYQVYSSVNAYQFNVVVPTSTLTVLKSAGTITGIGPIFKLQSVRLKDKTDLAELTPLGGWNSGDKLWVDNDQNTNGWVVYNKSEPWTTANASPFAANMQLDANSYATGTGFGTVTTLSPSATFSAAGMPTSHTGNVIAFVSNVANGHTFTRVANIGAPASNSTTNFGASLDSTDNLLLIGAPGNGSTEYGRVHIYSFDGTSEFTYAQTISSPFTGNTGDQFGYSIAADDSGTWLYVGAPNAGNVYVYHANVTGYYSYANTITGNGYVYGGVGGTTKFGHTVATTTDGSHVTISSPYERVNGVSSAGAVYVFNRNIESFLANGRTAYYTQYPITSSTVKVTVNGNVVTEGFTSNSSAVEFDNAPVVGTTVTIDTNKIQLVQKLSAPAPSSGAAFGIVSTVAGNDADVYVSSPGYSEPGYYSGIVYRFVDTGANYGTLTSTVTDATVTSNDHFFINGFKVTWTGTTLSDVVDGINNSGIPGVSAVLETYGLITITSTSTVPFQKLIVTPGSGTALTDIGLGVYADVQEIKHPGATNVQNFGSQVVSTADSKVLIISADRGATYNRVTFDSTKTIFDTYSTEFYDADNGSGVVYVYGLVEGSLSSTAYDQYVLVQGLENNSLSANDQFGYSLALNANILLVGAPGDSNHTTVDPLSELIVNIPSAGTYYTYENISGNIGWDIIHSEQPKVDIDSITRSYIYNTTTSTLLTNFDHIDPAKGKILGIAQQDLDYVTAYDPAVYNVSAGVDGLADVSYNTEFHWGSAQVTNTWWDLSKVRYVDYEQGSLTYRANNWGATFPGSKIQVAEWVMSTVPPSQYTGSGVPLYPNDTAYVIESYVDTTTKIVRSRYYYWVINKTTLESKSTHTNSVSVIQSMIENPQAQGIPYIAAIRDDSISVYNFSDYLIGSGNSVVFHADYDTLQNENIIHSEYALVPENSNVGEIPARLVNKMFDSLAGIDAAGAVVPDPSLPVQTRYGIGVNPNQTLFINRITALENFFDYVNSIFVQYPIVEQFNIGLLNSAQPYPGIENYDISVDTYAELAYIDNTVIDSGYAVLVKSDETTNGFWVVYIWNGTTWVANLTQEYNVANYWDYADWYKEGYNSTSRIDYLVDIYADLATVPADLVGDLAQVANRGNGQFAIYRWDGATWELVGLEAGTIQFNNNVYNDKAGVELRIILNTIKTYFESTNFDILLSSLGITFNSLFFTMINYILSEQKSVDWIFKTSFVKVLHQLRQLNQYPTYIQDNQTYYEDYINEVKPYRTSIREYLVDYTGNDYYSGDVTDFDVPATYNSNVGAYRSPNGSLSSDDYVLANKPQYKEWYNHHGYSINSVIVSNGGTGYFLQPNITVVDGGGSGAEIQAVVDFTSNTIVGFEVINPGSGYTSTPTIVINGTGTGAKAYPLLVNQPFVTSIQTQVIQLVSDVTVYAGNIITQPNTGAYGTASITSTGNTVTLVDVVGTFATNQYIFENASNLNVRVGTPTTSLTVTENITVSAGDTIEQPSTGITSEVWTSSTGNVLTLWNTTGTFSGNGWLYNGAANLQVTPTNFTINSAASPIYNYTAFVDQSYNKVRTFDQTIKFDRVTYSSNIVAWQPNVTVTAGTWVTYKGVGYEALVDSYSKATMSLNGNVSAVAGDTVTQDNNTSASAEIVSVGTNLITVTNIVGTFNRRGGNLLINDVATTSKPMVINNIFEFNEYKKLDADSYSNAGDRITAMYQPTGSMPGRDLAQLMTGIEYPGVTVQGVPFGSTTSNISGDVLYFQSNTSTLYSSNTSVIDFTLYGLQGALPISIVDHGAGTVANVTILNFNNDQMRITGPMANITLGNLVSIVYYDYNNPIYLDSSIQSSYLDTALGTRPQDINIDGGAYYDTYSSHAPEELVPGVTFDNLNITVYTGVNSFGNTLPNPPAGYTGNVGYRYVHNMRGNSASTNYSLWPQYYGIFESNTSVLTSNLHITDGNIYVADASAFATPVINRYPPIPGVVYINGEKITYWTVDRVNNVLGQIRRAVDGTGAANVHVAGSSVVEASVNQLLPTEITANTHTTGWLNAIGDSGIRYIVDDIGHNIVDDLGSQLVSISPTMVEFLTLSSNVLITEGDTISQPSAGATGVVVANTTASSSSTVVYFYSNTSTLYSSNTSVIDFTLYGLRTGDPVSIVDMTTSTTNTVTVANVATNQLTITGSVDDIPLGNDVKLIYSTGKIITVWTANAVGEFSTTIGNTYAFNNGANTSARITSVAYTNYDGLGLDGSTTPQALFIKGLA